MTDLPAQPAEILRVTQQFRNALVRYDKQALNRLIRAYEGVYSRLKDKIALLVDAIEMNEPTRGELVRMIRYQALINQVEAELTDYQVILRNEVGVVSQDAITFAGRDVARLLSNVGAGFNRLPVDTIKTLLGFLAEESPLYERIGQLAEANAQYVADKILEGVSLGHNPRVIAGIIRDSLGGGLTDALRMTRTVQLWSYRESTRANYVNNADVVEGWIWWADLPGDPCMACIAEHGGEHGLDETLNDHHNGKCAMLPIVKYYDNPVEQTGEDWFNGLSETKQRELMGDGKFEAWQGGKFGFDKLAGKHDDDVYGLMTIETTLAELVGE
jgi:hypothetical protein